MKRRIVLVTGLAGAGKTSAMAALEDMGYYCIDRLPASLIDELSNTIQHGNEVRYDHVALSVSAQDFYKFKHSLENLDAYVSVLFLDASYESLLLRYKHTRRKHPLLLAGVANSLGEAIELEQNVYSDIKEEATFILDTSLITQANLASRLQEVFGKNATPSLSVSFLSFGFRHGLPLDADLVFDVRSLKNPYWDETLRSLSGNDKPVYDYVINDEKTAELLKHLTDYLDFALQSAKVENRNHLTVAIGCTGGQHRSVSVTNWLFDHYHNQYVTFKNHRDAKEVYHD
ncbi:ATP-binding protein [Erysipelothrix larvae]|uniref:ATP-binding protein n=1 Tax=Erysipelothrix larvae TaxID=1514105 RepID=A0A0X8GY33_9FIRM|nr:RNase adapter RapZ [Erysipelothrix larvae]AMC92546.1 ATP-binding protein [Erysipelothrix larvae]